MHMDRRGFLKLSALSASIAALGASPAAEIVERRNGIPYRILGKTGERVSLLCVGGHHIGVNHLTDEESISLIRGAIDEGINFLDNAYVYTKGRSETRMGKALRDGYREKVFLMTKTYSDERDVATAKKQLEESLKRLQADVIDLWQVHQIMKPHHPKAVYDNGLPEMMVKAREEGKIRYIGFTGHSRPEWHGQMLDGGFAWDTVQMPVNPFDYHWTSFQQQILPRLLDRQIGVIGMKSMGGTPGKLVNTAKTLTARECLHYAMSQPVATVVSGMDRPEYFKANIQAARDFEPLSQAQLRDILARSADPAQGGQYESYKEKELS